MSDIELIREIKGLQGDKSLTKHAVTTKQEEMKVMLHGEMGSDMMAVLNGEKIIKVSKIEKQKFQIKNWFKKLFRKF